MQRSRRISSMFIMAVAFLCLLGNMFWPSPVLTLRTGDDRILFYREANYGDEFTLRFLHSYDREWVEETYVIRKGYFNITRHRFRAFGYDSRDRTFPGDYSLQDGYAVVENIEDYYESRMKEFQLRVAYTVPQMLIFEEETLRIDQIEKPGTLLALKLEHWSLLKKMFTGS